MPRVNAGRRVVADASLAGRADRGEPPQAPSGTARFRGLGYAPSVTITNPTTSRPRRRAPADLPFSFGTAELAETLSTERAEPDWLRAERRAAAAAFERLPIEPNQLYTQYLDLRAASLESVRPYATTAAAMAQPVDGLEDVAALIDLAEDRVLEASIEPAAAAAGVVIETFGAALERDPDGLRADLVDAGTLPDDEKLAMLARGFWSQGVRVTVPDGVRLERPILLRWRSSNPERALITRTILKLGPGASAALVEAQLPSGPAVECAAGETVPQGLFHGTTEVLLGREAHLAMASLQELGPDQVAFHHRYARVGEAATLRWALAQLGGRLVRSRVDNRLEGDRGTVEQVEIVFADEEQLFDLTSYTRHLGRDTTGTLLSKGVLLDRSRSFMKGMITIERSAVGTDSFLGEFGMNLSKAARAVAIPSLEIDQPDCRRAAHSSSVGPIDPAQLFYLESRGIDPDEARKFVVLGFLEPVVAQVPLDAAREQLRGLLEEKWAAGLRGQASAA